jgi:hypothetical protein
MTDKLKVDFSILSRWNIHIILAAALMFFFSPGKAMAEELSLERYLTTYDYAEHVVVHT